MSVFLNAVLPIKSLNDAYLEWSKLPLLKRKIEISESENDVKYQTSFANLLDEKNVVADKEGGYFLHSESAVFSVSLSDATVKFFIECKTDEVVQDLIKGLFNIPVKHVFAAQLQEREHQNRIIVKKKYGTHETWVGRDLTKYLPGVYWLNLVPKSLLEQHGIDAQSIDSISTVFKKVGDDKYLFQLYPNSIDWMEHAKSIDAWRLKTPGVFFKKSAETALEAASNFLEASKATGEWK